jgi:hypothetical protein
MMAAAAAVAAIVVEVTNFLVPLLCALYDGKCALPFSSQYFALHVLLLSTPYLTLRQLHSSCFRFQSSSSSISAVPIT